MTFILACQHSVSLCNSLREKGFTAFTCGHFFVKPDHPEWHIDSDVHSFLENDDWVNHYGDSSIMFKTSDGFGHLVCKRELVVLFSACTFIDDVIVFE